MFNRIKNSKKVLSYVQAQMLINTYACKTQYAQYERCWRALSQKWRT